MLTIDQIVAAPKAQLTAIAKLGNKAIESAGLLADLNLKTGKAILVDSATCAHDLLAAGNPQELLSVCGAAAQPWAERATDYGRSLYDIASRIGAEIGKLANAQATEAQKQFSTLIDSVLKNTPQGSPATAAAFRNAVSGASVAIESVQKAVKQATDLTEANFHALADTAPKVVPKTRD